MTDDFFLTPDRTPKYSFHFGKFSFSKFIMKTVCRVEKKIVLIAWKI